MTDYTFARTVKESDPSTAVSVVKALARAEGYAVRTVRRITPVTLSGSDVTAYHRVELSVVARP